MGNIYFYTGGARSGKSRAAVQHAAQLADVAYIATAIDTDVEMHARIKKHVEERPATWHTYECPYKLDNIIQDTSHKTYLIDCITVYVTNLIFQIKADWNEDDLLSFQEQQALEGHVYRKIEDLLDATQKRDADFIIVSNEVGMGIVPPNSLGRLFRDAAGRTNQMIAAAAKAVWLTVSGIPVKIKG